MTQLCDENVFSICRCGENSNRFYKCRFCHSGSRLYLPITRYVLKEEGRTLFLLPKVKVEFRHLFRFKNGLVFVLPIQLMQISLFFADRLVYIGITLVFKFQAVWTTSYHTQFRFIRT